MLIIKQQLYNECLAYLAKRIGTVREAIRLAQIAANDETKSSAGDKYETGRAMMQLEMEQHNEQLVQALKLKQVLDHIKIDYRPVAIQAGALAITDQGNFFVAISVGQLVIEGKTYVAVSIESPIGAKLKGLKEGETFTFNNKTYKIQQVW